jgi:3-methyl-2-oxobutanoate hydroxymethyltransferase
VVARFRSGDADRAITHNPETQRLSPANHCLDLAHQTETEGAHNMSTTKGGRTSKVTHLVLRQMKEQGERIAMLTAYDASFARLCDQAGTDVLLVGDSLGMVIQGGDNTLGVTMEHMIYHCRAVARGVSAATGRSMVVGDLPFMSYQTGVDEALRNAGRLIKEGEAEAVKLEGGAEYAELVSRMARIGIPVMGHIGLTPQSIHSLGGYRVQGREQQQAPGRHQQDEQAIATKNAPGRRLVDSWGNGLIHHVRLDGDTTPLYMRLCRRNQPFVFRRHSFTSA